MWKRGVLPPQLTPPHSKFTVVSFGTWCHPGHLTYISKNCNPTPVSTKTRGPVPATVDSYGLYFINWSYAVYKLISHKQYQQNIFTYNLPYHYITKDFSKQYQWHSTCNLNNYLLKKLPFSPIYFNPEKLVSCEYLTKKCDVLLLFFSSSFIISIVFRSCGLFFIEESDPWRPSIALCYLLHIYQQSMARWGTGTCEIASVKFKPFTE